MVVVSDNWVKYDLSYPSQPDNSNAVIATDNMTAKAILTCRPNSHLFQDRTLSLEQPLKVGRSVARAKPTATNAIFDCKVLSRHHALLWYENGKFYLQDTKSSNGTFVNNNRLTAESENHELSSGDIVQFGVDVVENNRKVTHGCIIATIKLFLPDGKEAKASPIDYEDRHGMVPLDDLYRLNRIIQEANQREQGLERKLSALQRVIDDTRRSAEDSWQAYVGEERLLSRVSALETRLQQTGKSWGGEDRLKEEVARLQDDNEAYQVAAKEALGKLHAERLQAVALAIEQERARLSAEQEAMLAKEQFEHAQIELEVLARKLTDHMNDADSQRMKLEEREQELEAKLESESGKLLDLQLKLHEMNALSLQDFQKIVSLECLRQDLIYNDDDVKCKEELIAENEDCESLMNKTNGVENHINLTVGPVEEKAELENTIDEKSDSEDSCGGLSEKKQNQEEVRQVTFNLPEECQTRIDNSDESHDESDTTAENDNEKDIYSSDVDSKTLKYQFQSAQKELKQKIEVLESIAKANKAKIAELDKALDDEKSLAQRRLEDNQHLRQDFVLLQQKWKESCNENQQYKDRVQCLGDELESAQEKLKEFSETAKEKREEEEESSPSNLVPYERLMQVEEELVALKDRFARVAEDKLKQQRELTALTEQYRAVCDRSHNKYFFYVAPLVFMVLYLLVRNRQLFLQKTKDSN
ncbi:unnamed protein product [Phaedon cochleariae]|uniref:Sarcolemmal membrane-associated protein n=1 Tax=Phaedon cochleariae TaxID=80249 RepID=A0A9N9S6Y7_PHACE|nr:unnamed protein product [Phaedon cochleariae]